MKTKKKHFDKIETLHSDKKVLLFNILIFFY